MRACGAFECVCTAWAVLAAAAASPSIADAAPPSKPWVDPALWRQLHTGRSGLQRAQPPATGRVAVLVHLDHPVARADIERLRSLGFVPSETNGHPAYWRAWIAGSVDAAALARLEKAPGVLDLDADPAMVPPLIKTTQQVRLPPARIALPHKGLMYGDGVSVADVDSDLDPFHPAFFRADAGWYDWIDVDGNGRLTPGVDAIDLDRDGKAGANETAQRLKSSLLSWPEQPGAANKAGLDPRNDWLYLDENGNGKRDFGAGAGFDETTPAYGEPLFVPDDCDRDGKVDGAERVARLGSSKIRALRRSDGKTKSQVFERGIDLVAAEPGAKDWDLVDHATAVVGILVGDEPLAGRTHVGMVPHADVVVGEYGLQYSATLLWALQQSPDVILFESSGWAGEPMDGTDGVSKVIDGLVASGGPVPICPAGNLAGLQRHAFAALAPGQERVVTLTVPASLGAAAVYVDLHVRGPGRKDVAVELRQPGGMWSPLADFACAGCIAYTTLAETKRDTVWHNAVLYTLGASIVPAGPWQLRLSAGSAMATVDAYVADDATGWEPGTRFEAPDVSPARTTCVPAVATGCMAVGAVKGYSQARTDEGVLQPAWFSSRGPRIDGVQKPDLVAPDNPFTARARSKAADPDYAALTMFGGTSGAGPHVAGAAALLVQAGVPAAEITATLRAATVPNPGSAAVPSPITGYGRLDVAAALGVAVTATGAAPADVAVAQEVVGEALVFTVTACADCLVRWDDGYDGSWDTAFAPPSPRTVPLPPASQGVWKLQAARANGSVTERAVRFQPPAAKPEIKEPPAVRRREAPAPMPQPEEPEVPVATACSARPTPATDAAFSLWTLAALATALQRQASATPRRS